MSLDVNDIAVSALLDTEIEILCLDLALLKLGFLGDLLGTLSITLTLLGLASYHSSLGLGVKTLTSLVGQFQVIIRRFDKIDFILEVNGLSNRNRVLILVSVHVDEVVVVM
ncbi:hypothetical protein c7_R45 [Megavirus courdo7]|uniref:Uncharacterized protein n=1 Tax=Megavirus courdo7 TaxID=1128135 RepID=H2E9N8_9VIRU|nr:hypothetical protein c7_R45 [Megavirus courdo7]